MVNKLGVTKEVLSGLTIGVANIIPGVSGGTFALILGIYDRLLGFLKNLSGVTLLNGWKIFRTPVQNGGGLPGLHDYLRRGDWYFVGRVALGVSLGILGLSKVMTYLLEFHFSNTYAYFFGLILASLPIPARLVLKWGWRQICALILGTAVTVGVVLPINPAEKAQEKSELLQLQQSNSQSTGYGYQISDFVAIGFGGAIAVSAMVLPGISGSLVLILMGQYMLVVRAIAGLHNFFLPDIVLLACFSLGMIVGLLSFSRILDAALRRWPQLVMPFLTGLVLGSLWALWPFKETMPPVDLWEKTGEGIHLVQNVVLRTQTNILPTSASSGFVALVLMLAGIITMIPFLLLQRRR